MKKLSLNEKCNQAFSRAKKHIWPEFQDGWYQGYQTGRRDMLKKIRKGAGKIILVQKEIKSKGGEK